MKLLAIDTSGDACSAALFLDGVIEQRLDPTPRRHGELLLPMMQALLESAGIGLDALDAIAFGRGPGSFTGVRIAVAVAQGGAFGAGCPTVPVSTLAAMAVGEYRRTGRRRVLAALDARMGEVYWGVYERSGTRAWSRYAARNWYHRRGWSRCRKAAAGAGSVRAGVPIGRR